MKNTLISLKKAYVGASILLLNTIILFVFINIGAYMVFRLLVLTADDKNPVLEKYNEIVFDAYPDKDKQDVTDLLAETWTRGFDYKPYLHFGESSFAGAWVNVHEVGFRQNGHSLPWPPEQNPGTYNIFVFGGSTTFGYGVADQDTIPARVEYYLSQMTDKTVRVYNFAVGAYISMQERILFETLLLDGYIPDEVVFIDGLNEFYFFDGLPEFNEMYSGVLDGYGTTDAWKSIAAKLPLMRLVGFLVKNDSGGMVTQESYAGIRYDDQEILDTVIDRYQRSMRIIEGIANEFSIGTLFVWQPVPHYYYDNVYHPFAEHGYGKHQFSQNGYRRMAERSDDLALPDQFLNLAYIQGDITEPLYVDLVHYNPLLCDMIAREIAQAILRSGRLEEMVPGRGLEPRTN